MRSLLAGLALVVMAAPATAQVTFSADAIEELQTLTVRVDVFGSGRDDGQLGGLLEEAIRQELRRADILFERGEPRADDCCVLRLDVRLVTGAGRARFGTGYITRLELGFMDRIGNVPTWTTLWAGRFLSNIVERPDLAENLRAAARDLVGQFIDLYRERFPR
ncbi:MAG: hypothetical protein ABI647_08645 [Gemmatimonadota bacterium]